VNVLAGKEFVKLGKKKNQTLAINAKMFYGGVKKIIPLLRDKKDNLAVDASNNKFWITKKRMKIKLKMPFKLRSLQAINLTAKKQHTKYLSTLKTLPII